MWGQPIIIIICFHLETTGKFITYTTTVMVLACTASALDQLGVAFRLIVTHRTRYFEQQNNTFMDTI